MVDDERDDSEEELERSETGIRILYTLLFFIVFEVVEFVLALVVIFGLVSALVTKQTPSQRLRDFADRVIRYGVQVVAYLTWNRKQPPFPFDDLPPERGPAPPPSSYGYSGSG